MTNPPSMYFHRYLMPYFPDDTEFIKEYNDLIHDTQKKRIHLIQKYFDSGLLENR